MKSRCFWGCLAALLTLIANGEDVLRLRCIPSSNLARNGDFGQVDANGNPTGWHFENCTNSPSFRTRVVRHPEGNYLAIDTAWHQFGYWRQHVAVNEGVAYCVSCDVQSDGPRPAVWIQCYDLKKTTPKSPGQLKNIIARSMRNGDELKEMLRDFIDEELINCLSPVKWNRMSSEVLIPIDCGVKLATLRVGIYGGNAGQARLRNLVFREAKAELKVEVLGTGWTELRVPGASPETAKLDSSREKQEVSFTLPRAPRIYKVELLGLAGQRVKKEIANE